MLAHSRRFAEKAQRNQSKFHHRDTEFGNQALYWDEEMRSNEQTCSIPRSWHQSPVRRAQRLIRADLSARSTLAQGRPFTLRLGVRFRSASRLVLHSPAGTGRRRKQGTLRGICSDSLNSSNSCNSLSAICYSRSAANHQSLLTSPVPPLPLPSAPV